jgi:large subunit ribosomal protein L21
MFAVVDIAGHQFKVSADQFLYVNRLPQAEGEEFTLDSVMMVANGANVQVGAPFVQGASVKAKVLSHLKDDKVLVFKKKRRKGYKKMNGHRQPLTKIQIQSIKA